MKMSLENVVKGKVKAPLRTVVYGPPGIGKSTFAAGRADPIRGFIPGAPSPIYLCGEDGTRHLDVARMPLVESWADIVDALTALASEEHGYRTLVVDTLDSLEPHVQREAFRRLEASGNSGKATCYAEIGFARGPDHALDVWSDLLSRIDALAASRGMHTLLLAHSVLRVRKDPTTDDYERFTLKLEEKKAAPLIMQHYDDVLFATQFDAVVKGKSPTGRVVSVGDRVLVTRRVPGADAKSRHGLPETIPLEWAAYESACGEAVETGATELDKRIAELMSILPDDATRIAARNWIYTKRITLAGVIAKIEEKKKAKP